MSARRGDRRGRTAGALRLALAVLLATIAVHSEAGAFEPREGVFVARAACPATASIRRGDDRDAVAVAPGERYRLLGMNADPPSHYLVRVPGSDPPDRWVAIDCGRIRGVAEAAGGGPDAGAADPGAADADAGAIPRGDYVLALSWQPAFCETAPDRRECRTRRANGPEGERLALHGLWFRDRDRIDCPGPGRPRLSPETRRALEAVMPGTRSDLEDHQWRKHGRCFGVPAEVYFAVSAALARRVARSPVGAFLADRVGAEVSAVAVGRAFDAAFGRGAGRAVGLACARDGDRRLVVDLRIGLSGPLGPDADLGALMRAAPGARRGCARGVVDAAGLR